MKGSDNVGRTRTPGYAFHLARAEIYIGPLIARTFHCPMFARRSPYHSVACRPRPAEMNDVDSRAKAYFSHDFSETNMEF